MKILEQHSVGLGKMNQEEIEGLNRKSIYRERVENSQNNETLISRPSVLESERRRKIKSSAIIAMPPRIAIEIKRSILKKLTIRLLEEGLFIR